MRVRIVELEETSIARQRLGKDVSTATHNNESDIRSGVFCLVSADAV
jgi:hypothetical protein